MSRDYQVLCSSTGKEADPVHPRYPHPLFRTIENGTIRGVESFDFPKNGCSVLVSKVWCACRASLRHAQSTMHV